MDFLTKVIPDDLVKAICNTLLHSLWQGLLLAVVVGVMMVLTRSITPARRYQLLIGLLFIFGCGVMVTFSYQFRFEAQVIPEHLLFKQYPVVDVLGKPLLGDSVKTADYQGILSFLNGYSNVIILVWLVMMLVKTFRLLTDLQFIYHLRRRKLHVLGKEWEDKVQQLAVQLGIKQIVSIAESGIARIPMVIGHFKPLILIPMGLVIALPPAAIEAILVHELAHIYRRDYLVNVLISLMEIVFFFNPAVLWIASLIRDERENCCDDIAVKYTGNKVGYVKALVACQEYHLTTPNYAMALNGQKKHLASRVKRLIFNHNPSLNMMEKIVLAVCLVTVVGLTAAFTNAKKIDEMVISASQKMATVGRSLIVNNEQAEKTVHTTTKPSAEIPKTNYVETVDTAQFKIFRPEQVGDHTSVVIPNGNVETHLIKRDGILYQVNSNQNHVISLQRNGYTITKEKVPTYLSLIDSLHVVDQSLARQSELQRKYLGDVADSLRRRQSYLTQAPVVKTGVEKSISYKIKSEVPIDVRVEKGSNDVDVSTFVLNAIVNDGLASEVKSYKLSEFDLIVNGKKVDDDIFQRFKNKNIKSFAKRTIVYYNYDATSTTTTTKTIEN